MPAKTPRQRARVSASTRWRFAAACPESSRRVAFGAAGGGLALGTPEAPGTTAAKLPCAAIQSSSPVPKAPIERGGGPIKLNGLAWNIEEKIGRRSGGRATLLHLLQAKGSADMAQNSPSNRKKLAEGHFGLEARRQRNASSPFRFTAGEMFHMSLWSGPQRAPCLRLWRRLVPSL